MIGLCSVRPTENDYPVHVSLILSQLGIFTALNNMFHSCRV